MAGAFADRYRWADQHGDTRLLTVLTMTDGGNRRHPASSYQADLNWRPLGGGIKTRNVLMRQ